MEKKLYRPSFETRHPEQEEDIDLEAFPGQPGISPDSPVDEEESDGSASAFEGTEIPREDDDRDLSDKDLDDLLADEA